MSLDLPTSSVHVSLQWVGQEAILYDRQRGRAHVINRSAAQIWALCDGRATVEEIVSAFGADCGMSPTDVHADVMAVITSFRELGVIE